MKMLHNLREKGKGLLTLLALSALAVVAVGCAGGGSDGGPGAGGSGTLAVRLADAPDPTISALNVTISRVEAHLDGRWRTLTTAPQTFNLLDLVKNDTLLAQATLPAGRYNQVRLFVDGATVTDSAGTHDVTVPSGSQSGIKINLNYTIDPNELTEILLDFNVQKSLIKQGNGNYRLQPVIPAVVKVLSGTITGTATDGTSPLNNASVKATYAAGSSYALGTEVNATSSLPDGTFKLWALLPGAYTLSFSYTDSTSGAIRTATRTDVVVTANADNALGSIPLQ
jgi:hypothetical protein